jgi:hypothetical protein
VHPTKIVTIIKSLTAREVFRINLEVKQKFWGGEFWTDGYYVNTVSKFGDEDTIAKYVKQQQGSLQHKLLRNNTKHYTSQFSWHSLKLAPETPSAYGGVVHLLMNSKTYVKSNILDTEISPILS